MPQPGLEAVAGRLVALASLVAKGVRHSVDGLTALGGVDEIYVTHYGASFNGQALGCDANPYSSDDGSIVAVGPERDAEWPCGTILHVCGPGGCIVAERVDGCPGCGAYHVDLSEEGLLLVCGPGSGVCKASLEAFRPACSLPAGLPSATADGPLGLFAVLAEAALEDRTADMLDLTRAEGRGYACLARGQYAPPVLQP